MILTIIKYMSITVTSLYICFRLLDKKYNSVLSNLLFFIIMTSVVVVIRICFPPMTIVSIVFVLTFFCCVTYPEKSKSNLVVSVFSVSISYILYALGIVVSIPVTLIEYIIVANVNFDYLFDILAEVTIDCIQIILCILLFRMKRFSNGVSRIIKKVSGDIGLYVCFAIIFFASLFFPTNETYFRIIYTIIVLFVCVLGFITYLWWSKRITNDYINKVQQRNLDTAEQTIARQKEEIEYLSKIVHKDNKLIGALELSLNESEGVDKDRLFAMSKERESILHTYKESEEMMQKTGVFSIDMMINYLLKRAFEQGSAFEVVVTGNINYMIQNVIDEEDLSTLLADIGENAVIVVSTGARRNILLSIGVRENSYYIDVYDSGAPFDVNVIENYGRTRYTTHKATGGSGIGLMTTKELLSKYKASFEVEEIANNSLYTKRVSIVFDSLSQTRIFTNRQEILELRNQRNDIDFYESLNAK